MKNFSDETNKKRTGVYIKVFVKRYINFLALPMLILFSYCIGVLSKPLFYDKEVNVTIGQCIAAGYAVFMILIIFGYAVYSIAEKIIRIIVNLFKEIAITARRIPRRISKFIEKEKKLFMQDVEKELKKRR